MTNDPNYPPQYAPQPQRRRMSTGKKISLGCILPIVVIGAFAGGCAALVGGAAHEADKSAKADRKEDARALKEDVKVTTCEIRTGALGREAVTKVKITNHGKKRANYLIEGEMVDSKRNQLGDLLASATNLAPGASTTQEFGGSLIASDQLKSVGPGTCRVLEVTRDEWSAAN
jgi:hypothetical protein